MFIRPLLCITILVILGCKPAESEQSDTLIWYSIEVTATAYNSVSSQTDDTPLITAFGDSLKPGKKYIAVSRDLLRRGLVKDTPVKIEGFDSIYLVKDKMNKRWTNRIDIYMGNSIKDARNWGKRTVCITYGEKLKKPDIK